MFVFLVEHGDEIEGGVGVVGGHLPEVDEVFLSSQKRRELGVDEGLEGLAGNVITDDAFSFGEESVELSQAGGEERNILFDVQ